MSQALTWVSEEEAQLTITTDPGVELTRDTDYTLTVPQNNTAGGSWTISFTQVGKISLQQATLQVLM